MAFFAIQIDKFRFFFALFFRIGDILINEEPSQQGLDAYPSLGPMVLLRCQGRYCGKPFFKISGIVEAARNMLIRRLESWYYIGKRKDRTVEEIDDSSYRVMWGAHCVVLPNRRPGLEPQVHIDTIVTGCVQHCTCGHRAKMFWDLMQPSKVKCVLCGELHDMPAPAASRPHEDWLKHQKAGEMAV